MRFLAALLVLALALPGCAARQDDGRAQGFIQGDGSAQVLAPTDRQPAPAVDAETVGGGRLALRELDDGPVVVNFWASWCGPCVREAPALANVARAYADQGVQVVGVNVKDRRANAQAFERDLDVPYESWYDEAAAIAADFGGIGPAALPSTIVLDADHRVAVRLAGAVTEPQLSVYLDRLLDERSVGQDAAGDSG
ncbi:MAG: TlpA family protein disulfide reductase [Actinomycetota bacterium]|nr:TlpA family protein disulfide reductase [Euzebyales bacterium]MDQ3342405.1 TlpA family protein disulfide reductase [Actinomycetota bacterium]MDQ3530571.1 TlpA family protein disulfide reductase [Actinomycetota bacterium]